MSKRSHKAAIRHDEHHSGCIRGLINIFDFRHARPSQKLIADTITGPASTIHELSALDGSCETCRIAEVGNPCETSTSDKMSVKELMEEEMFKQDQLTKMNSSGKDSKHSSSHENDHRRKNRWHKNKKSFDLSDVNITSEKPTHRKHKSMSSLEVGEMVAELCTEINVKDVDCLNRVQTSEDKLAEATKVFVSHFIDGKNIMKDAKFQASGELIEALQILNSNKDTFLKLVQDPSSQLVEHIEKLVDHHAEQDDNSKVIELDHGKNKLQTFFWRKFKGLERNLSKKHEHSQNVSTIVVLKPGPATVGHGNKLRSERASANFLFADFTKKLKRAMRKEQPVFGNLEKAVGGEGLTMASPTRDHFFIEKIPRKSISGKKHLAETVGTSDADVDLLSRKVPQPLGRILSWSGYNSSPMCSPRNDEGRSLMSSPRNSFNGKESETHDKITVQQVQEDVNHQRCSDNSELRISTEKILEGIEAKILDMKSLERSSQSATNEINLEGCMDNIRPTDAELDARISVNISSEPCGPSSTNELAKATPVETSEKQTMCLNMDIVEQVEPCSPLTSPIVCSTVRKVEDSVSITDGSDWTSPISVLKPIYQEDDVSPSIKSFPVAELIQPRKIIFEDQISPCAPCLKTREEERISLFEFVKDVLRVSRLTETQLLERFLLGENLLDPSLFYEVDFIPDCRFHDPMLVFHLIEEVLTEICEREFDGIPSLSKPYVSLDFTRTDITDEIWKGVSRHLQTETVQTTLDHTVAKDLSVSSTWMDLRNGSESIGIELEEDIFEELIEDTIFACIMSRGK